MEGPYPWLAILENLTVLAARVGFSVIPLRRTFFRFFPEETAGGRLVFEAVLFVPFPDKSVGVRKLKRCMFLFTYR